MFNFPIGVIIDSFRTDIPSAVKKAAAVGAQGIQVYSTYGEMAPENLSTAKRKEFAALVADSGLQISALCGDLGGGGFTKKKMNKEKVNRSKEILNLAKELGTAFPPEDLVKIGKYQVVCKLSIDSETTQPFYATTLPPLSCKNQQRDKLIRTSQMHWGKKKE